MSDRERLEAKLLRAVGKASAEFGLLEPGDRVMVGMSGGKDSYTLLHLLRLLQKKAPFEFELLAVNLDQGHPGFDVSPLVGWLEANGHPYRLLQEDTYRIVTEKIPEGKTYCSLCSRLRRGVLYNAAVELGCTKIALGHHRDDAIETLMLNLLYSGKISAMPARLRSDDGRNVVIRPLITSDEDDIAAFAKEMAFPILPCDLCGSQDGLKRQAVKGLLKHLQDRNPHVRSNLFAALSNVRPSHLLDPKLWELAGEPRGTDEGVL